ncbi:hypothetical protein WA026_016188 [Henosepilachna vigintioctopunctata]|uniref:Ferritin n=1 Tax=Henosepilachna vigintioctopunctata TaxID=420089 RepID=A0AAW1TWD7_9CUCU
MALLYRNLNYALFRKKVNRNLRGLHGHYYKYTPEKIISYKIKTFKERPKSYNKIYFPLYVQSNANDKSIKYRILAANYTTCPSTNQDKGGRHKYHQDVENALNQQILTEFNASYAYLAMSSFFGRTDIALPGCQGFFYNMYMEEIEHAIVFINYQLMRGGHVALFGLEAPEKEWGCIEKALETALDMEKTVKEKITGVLQVAEKHCDYQVIDFLTTQYLKEQNESIQKMGRLLTRAKKMVNVPDGEFLFDRQLFKNYVKDDNFMFSRELSDVADKSYK